MLINENDITNLTNLLTGFGNLLYNNPNNIAIAKDMDISSNLKEISGTITGTQEEINYMKEIQNFLIEILK